MGSSLDVTKIPPGTVLVGKYRVERTLGVGGMGVVVACEHLTLGTRVALKFLLPQFLANPGIAKRFVREAQAAIRITSEHVARVMDVDTLPDGLPFMVMEYLQGKDLAALVDSGRHFVIEEALDYIVQAAEALAQAHHVGVVHRDVKPANIFLVQRGDDLPLVKVLDFGISKMLDEPDSAAFQRGLTKTTTVLGSGLYMSPEQMRSAKTVDQRTDIYALGIVLYEVLSHTQPYTAESFADLAVRVSTEPPDPLRRHRPDVPEGLALAIERAYARRPEDRHQSIAELVADLAPFAAPATLPLVEAIRRIGAGRGFSPGGVLSTTGPDRELDDDAAAPGPRWPTTGGGSEAKPTRISRPPTTGGGSEASPTRISQPPPTDGTGEANLARGGTAMAATANTGPGTTTSASTPSLARRVVPWVGLSVAAAVGAVIASYLLGEPLVGPRRGPASPSTAVDSGETAPPAPTTAGEPDDADAGLTAELDAGAVVEAPLDGAVGSSDGGATRRIPTVTITSERTPGATGSPVATTEPGPLPSAPDTTAPPTTAPEPTTAPGSTGPSGAGPCFRKDPETGLQQMVPCE